ncbi:MAG TPA: hypothetical protein VMV45_17730 [Casimicrobiaceae bacterium]|nr:hypothetical protein [Casimicrobiaceae bacterium]
MTSGNGQAAAADFDRLVQDWRAFVSDAEALLRNARTLSGEGAAYARTELGRQMDQARQRFGDLRSVANERAGQMRASTEDYVRREPFKAIAIAAAAGALVALLMSRRS